MASIRICPKCKKSTLKPAFNVSGWCAPEMYRCKKCEYVGYYYIEVDTEENITEEDKEGNLIKKDDITGILTNLCENCGSKLRKNSNYCSECGFNREQGGKIDSSKIIPKNLYNCIFCGSKIKKKDKFCVVCGTQIEI